MKEYPKRWTDEDFESMSWHDNHVHGMRILNPYEGYDFDLVLDIDHILEWMKTGKYFKFMVAPATLTFHDVDKLIIDLGLSYKEHLVIDSIEREEITAEYGRRFRWRINIQSLMGGKKNTIAFNVHGFTQKLTKEPVGPTGGWLEDGER
jgi:hypothetical protein